MAENKGVTGREMEKRGWVDEGGVLEWRRRLLV